MGTITSYGQLTLFELANRIDPNGNLATIAEVLSENNEMLMDAKWVEANDTFSHKSTRRLSLPSGTWRKLNAGVAKQSSQTIPVVDVIGMLETYSEVDKALADAAPNPQAFRFSEAKAFLEGLSQTLAYTFIYGNANIDVEKFTGLAPRMASLATDHVIGCSGTGSDLTSVYVVQWGEDKVHMVYPKGSKAGIYHEDKGQVTALDSSSNYFEAYRDWFKIHCGLVVRDERCIKRVCNIETAGTSNLFDEDKLIQAINNMPNRGRGGVIYVNPTLHTQMDIALKDKTNVNFTYADGLGGVPVLTFRGLPVRTMEQIVNTETALT